MDLVVTSLVEKKTRDASSWAVHRITNPSIQLASSSSPTTPGNSSAPRLASPPRHPRPLVAASPPSLRVRRRAAAAEAAWGAFPRDAARACALYNNWWPMLTVLMYLILPMPLIFFLGSNSPSMMSNDGDTWVNFTKFLTGASIVGSIAIPSILKHAGVIGWGALTMELSSFLVFGVAILWLIQMNSEDEYSSAF
uniref:Uncharacterized protein n=2 Tax=Oryza TaxID=4527 RepID=A0A0E0GE79_ORYNI